MTKFKTNTQKSISALERQVAELQKMRDSDRNWWEQRFARLGDVTDKDRIALTKRIAKMEDEYSVRFTPDEFETVKQKIVEQTLTKVGIQSPAFTQEVCKAVKL